jgi:hypothetical protein
MENDPPTPPPDATGTETSIAPLTDVEVTVLELERHWWRYPGAKAAHVRAELGMPLTRCYQVLTALIDNPAALAADPVTVHRLQRVRTQRRSNRPGGNPTEH